MYGYVLDMLWILSRLEQHLGCFDKSEEIIVYTKKHIQRKDNYKIESYVLPNHDLRHSSDISGSSSKVST